MWFFRRKGTRNIGKTGKSAEPLLHRRLDKQDLVIQELGDDNVSIRQRLTDLEEKPATCIEQRLSDSERTLERLDGQIRDILSSDGASGDVIRRLYERIREQDHKNELAVARVEELANRQVLTKTGIDNAEEARKAYTDKCWKIESRVHALEDAAACPVCKEELREQEL